MFGWHLLNDGFYIPYTLYMPFGLNFSIKNRHLQPHIFSKEIVLEFNLGPQHLLEGLVQEVMEIMKKQYVYKRDTRGKLVTKVSRLADPSHGSAVKTFRKIKKSKPKFPLKFWNM